uniref:RxLR effector protein n=1 Tax=Peronospora matthiolae TaxID=2874970 RepID=A0AAV1U0W4_9STRA
MVKCTPLLALTVIASAGSDALPDPTVERLAKLVEINQPPTTQSISDSRRVLRVSVVPDEVAAGEARASRRSWEGNDQLGSLKEKLISTSVDDLEAGTSENALAKAWHWLTKQQPSHIETKKTPADEILEGAETTMDPTVIRATHDKLDEAGVSVSEYVKALNKLDLPGVDVLNRGFDYKQYLEKK